ncbi:hypothetical protein [Neobacillus sp. LXY-1]|uniref:hypothetical protein n=1 Tax=Neobacillus sp. LXY-1 TaxID=3379133 RepID=UPI003EDFBB43
MNFHNKIFVCTTGGNYGDIRNETAFYFKQYGKIVRATYNGGNILYGELIGLVNDEDIQHVTFNHVTNNLQLTGGRCTFTPETPIDASLTLHGAWLTADAVEDRIVLEEL